MRSPWSALAESFVICFPSHGSITSFNWKRNDDHQHHHRRRRCSHVWYSLSLARSFSLVCSFLQSLSLLFYKLNSIRDNQSPHACGTFPYIIDSYQNMICTRLTMSLLMAVRLRSCWQGSTRWNPSYVLIETTTSSSLAALHCFKQCRRWTMFSRGARARSLFFYLMLVIMAVLSAEIFLLLFFDSLLRGKETTNYCQWECVFDWKEVTRKRAEVNEF